MSKPTDAWLRGGAGPMRDRRAPRGGERAQARREIEEALVDFSQDPEPPADTSCMSNAVHSVSTTRNPEPKPVTCGGCGATKDSADERCRICGDSR